VFRESAYEVSSFTRAQADITDGAVVEQILTQQKPAVVLNAAAYNQVDRAEQEPVAAFEVNALAVRNVSVACREIGARLVHFSTDYVFDGQAGRPYREDDAPHPLSAYAVSKLAGELYASAYLDHALIVRTSGVYGPGGMDTARGNFVEMMLRLAAQGLPIRVLEDHVASPTYAPALARVALELVQRNVEGIVHAGGGTPISWFDWAAKIFEAARLKPQLTPTNEREFKTAARRPKYSALANTRMAELNIAPMPPLDQAIGEYLAARERRAARAS